MSAQEEARMFEESAIMTPPAELPGYFKGRERGSFPDVAHEITLDLWYYHHQVRAQEFLPYSDALFTEPPDMSGPNPLTYYVAVFNPDGTYKFQPHDKKALGIFSAPRRHPTEFERENTIDAFIGLMSVIYNRRCWIPTMKEARRIGRLCKRLGAFEAFAAWMNERFDKNNWSTLGTLHLDPISNIQFAEEIRHRRMYRECFILLLGQIVAHMHPGLLEKESGLSELTQRELKRHHIFIHDHSFDMARQAGRLFQDFINLTGLNAIQLKIDLIVKLNGYVETLKRDEARTPALYLEFREIVLSMANEIWIEKATDDQRARWEHLMGQIDLMLLNKLYYHEERFIYFTNLGPEKIPWEVQTP